MSTIELQNKKSLSFVLTCCNIHALRTLLVGEGSAKLSVVVIHEAVFAMATALITASKQEAQLMMITYLANSCHSTADIVTVAAVSSCVAPC